MKTKPDMSTTIFLALTFLVPVYIYRENTDDGDVG